MGMDTLVSEGVLPTAALPDEEIVRRVRAGDGAVFEIAGIKRAISVHDEATAQHGTPEILDPFGKVCLGERDVAQG